MRRLAPAAAVLAVLCCAAPAQARRLAIKGAPAAGPSTYDRVHVDTYGSSRARNVMVLVPGTGAGSLSMAPIARDLVKGAKGLQVWTLDRREQAFMDLRVLGKGDPAQSKAHYLGFKYRRVTGERVPFVAEWGLATSVNDIRRVVRKARAGGRRRVFLGGHSRGASTAAAYAAWDFRGRAGYRDLAGLFLIDGGLLGALAGKSASQIPAAAARDQLAAIRGGKVFNDPLGSGIPESGPILLQLAAQYAAKQPQRRSALRDSALLPAALKPPFSVTNEAFLGRSFDRQTAPAGFKALRVNSGRLARSGNPRRWVSGEITPIQTFARTFSRPRAAEWYFPQRLVLDIAAANPMRRDALASSLGLRLWHTKRIDTPLYAYETDFSDRAVRKGALRLVRRSRIEDYLVVTDTRLSHLDAVLAPRRTNAFTRSAAKFLKKLTRRRR